MGFFDRFKKQKDEPMKEEKRREPLTIQYSDGTVAEITFGELCEVDGKMVHSATVIYTDRDNGFTSRRLLLEPIMGQANGQWQDATEAYYRGMSERDGSEQSKARYSALKGFFKKQEITEQKMGSNYIGNIAQKEDGQYYRYFDQNFKRQQTEKIRAANEAGEQARVQREDDFMANLRSQVEDKPVHIKTSHAEHLTPEKSPFEGR